MDTKKTFVFFILSLLPTLAQTNKLSLFDDLYDAIDDLNEEKLKNLIENGANINKPDDDNDTLLHIFLAANTGGYVDGDIQRIKLLLKYGANTNAKDNEGNTPMHEAIFDTCTNSSLEVVELLVKNGADVDIKNKLGETPLFYTLITRNPESISFLIKNGADINAKNNDGNTVLHKALKRLKSGMVALLLKHNADKNIRNGNNETPIEWTKKQLQKFPGHRKLEEILGVLENSNQRSAQEYITTL